MHRAFALDTSRHLALGGRYPRWLALPDRWVSWVFGAVPAGQKLIRRHRPEAIWSTYPIASAHLIGLVLAKLTGLPWIADMRDPMTDVDYPVNPLTRRVYRWIEDRAVRHSCAVVCTTAGAVRNYQQRYPDVPPERFLLVENGYDEENFNGAPNPPPRDPAAPFTLVHSGIVYPSERDPVELFAALAALQAAGQLRPGELRVVLRATAHDEYLAGLIARHGIGAFVTLAPHIPYREALAEMLGADGLLVLQAANCNHQIPAKLYEYLRAGRPVLALTDPVGDTAGALLQAGIDTIAPLDRRDLIAQALLRFIGQVRAGTAPVATPSAVAGASRRARAAQLARLLDQLAARGVTNPVPNQAEEI
ncbi:glycosyltransferase [Pseudoduganella plicata]|uniref:glycosyltransferase n=1 Tax=Pseudoduganella plicata TaxID=321984 RepID=UPI0027D9BB18|nr:glycosyltransferase [Pseudoduganella plicata]